MARKTNYYELKQGYKNSIVSTRSGSITKSLDTTPFSDKDPAKMQKKFKELHDSGWYFIFTVKQN